MSHTLTSFWSILHRVRDLHWWTLLHPTANWAGCGYFVFLTLPRVSSAQLTVNLRCSSVLWLLLLDRFNAHETFFHQGLTVSYGLLARTFAFFFRCCGTLFFAKLIKDFLQAELVQEEELLYLTIRKQDIFDPDLCLVWIFILFACLEARNDVFCQQAPNGNAGLYLVVYSTILCNGYFD